MMFNNPGKRAAIIFTLFAIVSIAFNSGLLFADASLDIGTELVSTLPELDVSNSNGWIGLSWMGSRYFSDTLSLFADASFKTAYTPLAVTLEAISSGDVDLSYRKNPFLIRWGISGYYDLTSTERIITPLWQTDTSLLFSYGTYKFSVYAEPGVSFKQKTDMSLAFKIKTGAAYAVNDELLLKPAVSFAVPLINSNIYTSAVKPALDISWYLNFPLSVENKLSCTINLQPDNNDFVFTWTPEISMLIARSVTASLRSLAEYRTDQNYSSGMPYDISLGYAESQYEPSLELVPALLLDFNLSDSVTLHSQTGLDWLHYFQSSTDNFTAYLSLDIEIEF